MRISTLQKNVNPKHGIISFRKPSIQLQFFTHSLKKMRIPSRVLFILISTCPNQKCRKMRIRNLLQILGTKTLWKIRIPNMVLFLLNTAYPNSKFWKICSRSERLELCGSGSQVHSGSSCVKKISLMSGYPCITKPMSCSYISGEPLAMIWMLPDIAFT